MLAFYYESLGAMLDAVEATPRTGVGGYKPCGAGGSTVHDASFYGRPLAHMVADCRAMLPFASAISDTEAMARELTVLLPPPRSVKRRRVRSADGDLPDVDRMLSGDLAHAWVTTRKILHDDPTALTTIILPVSYAGVTPQAEIYWNMAATLALSALLEDSGRRTCLISLEYTTLTGVRTPTTLSAVTILKAHEAPWSLQEAVITTDRAYFRRLLFRLRDCLPDPPDIGYGYVPSRGQLQEHIAWCSQEYDWRHVITGAHPQHDTITNRETAIEWMEQQLKDLEAVAL